MVFQGRIEKEWREEKGGEGGAQKREREMSVHVEKLTHTVETVGWNEIGGERKERREGERRLNLPRLQS